MFTSIWLSPKNRRGRHAVKLMHGFRKFTATQMGYARIHDEVREMLLGHKLPGMADFYQKYSQEYRLEQYLKAVPSYVHRDNQTDKD